MRPLVLVWVTLIGVAVVTAQVRTPGDPWRAAPGYLAIVAPVGDRAAAYRVYVSPLDLEATVRRLAADASLIRAPGAWQARPTLPAEAFGQAGRYDRSAMARLYGAQSPRVARGARMENGRVAEAWTLVAPYPDPSLSRLESGTLLVVLRLP